MKLNVAKLCYGLTNIVFRKLFKHYEKLVQLLYRYCDKSPSRNKNFVSTNKISKKAGIEPFLYCAICHEIQSLSKYFVNDCLWKHCLASNSPPDPFKFDLFDIFRRSNAFESFNLKSEQIVCEKALKFVLIDNYFPDLFIVSGNTFLLLTHPRPLQI